MIVPTPAISLRATASACVVEPIHRPGTIQPHGILLVADPASDMRVVAASENADALNPDGGDPLGRRLDDVVGSAMATGLRDRVHAGPLRPNAPWEAVARFGDRPFDVVCHQQAGLVLVELVASEPGDAAVALDTAARLQQAMATLREQRLGLDELASALVRSIRALTGYERVLVYQFDSQWNGTAVAEDIVAGGPDPLLGLHFPESDIPAQARALYSVAPMRWTLSRDAVPVRLRSLPGQPPIDLSHGQLRSLSPIHLEYHRNLGVDGAMSISIMDDGRLWGLVVCHHRQPHRTTSAQRAAAMALTDAFALRIGPAEHAGSEEARRAEQGRYESLIAHMADSDDVDAALTSGPVSILDMFGAGGTAVVHGDRVFVRGQTPDEGQIARLAAWLRAKAPDTDVFATASLPAHLPGWEQAGIASGLLAVFLDPTHADMLLWFRPEEPMTVTWGGEPHKDTDAAGRILPRRSFARWAEERRGTARDWAPHEIEIAGQLRHAITEVILRNVRRVSALNEQLRQSQKMEAVGQLTGGLAHDFNNLLGGITSSIELAQMRLAQGRTAELDRYLTAALGAASRAASLTNRLLAFSRRQTLDPRTVDVNRLIRQMEELIRGTIGASIRLECIAGAGLWTVLCDANQLENALLNLVLNARDAMPNGGRLTIEATNVRMDDKVAAGYDMPPGHYVALSVTDSGVGMPPEVAARVFEPFYTTKPLGEGTGLGLSMVYGFTRQSGGEARIYSEPGLGTTVRLYLPRQVGGLVEMPMDPEQPPAPPAHAPRVLVIDDEPVLRAMICEALMDEGYAVLEAADGASGLAILDQGNRVDLLLTDVGLPGGMNGRQVMEAARERRPSLKVLFITGYAENAALAGGLLDPVTQVLTKPFGLQALLNKVRAMTEAYS